MPLKVAIMQPYYFPYLGYYRLFASVDLFVVLDCVQFPRRGWVHRNQMSDHRGQTQWITLPLSKGPQAETLICDLAFPPDAQQRMQEQYRRFPCLAELEQRLPDLAMVMNELGNKTPVQYLMDCLDWICHFLGVRRPMMLASELRVPDTLHAQDRIIEIARRVAATDYINAPGGRLLYDTEAFAAAGLNLQFLPDYQGSYVSILERVLTEPLEGIREELSRNLVTRGR